MANDLTIVRQPADPDTMYRYSVGPGGNPWLHRCEVLKRTPRGKWISDFGKRRFVLNEGRKRFAWETPELALESLRIRLARRIGILKANLQDSEDTLLAVERVMKAPVLPEHIEVSYTRHRYYANDW